MGAYWSAEPRREPRHPLAALSRSHSPQPAGGPLTDTVFNLPDRLAAKADPALIANDERHFAAIAASLEHSIADASGRLDAERRRPGGGGQAALDRDLEIHRLTGRLRTLRRFGLDLCLGRIVATDAAAPVYIGRLGLNGADGTRLLVDWRSPAAEPFFAATHGDPMGLESRRRYRWTRGRISDYWDEVFTPEGLEERAALDDQSAFIASLGSTRSPRMRDVLATIQADQDAIIRAGSRGALVVDGGPGTGKTVVALHRAAYLLYSDARLAHRRGGVLFVGPHQAFLDYVADILPGLGEEGVETATLRDLVPEGAAAVVETDAAAARLKASARLVTAIEGAVDHYERPPTTGMAVETNWSEVWLDPADWAEAFDAPEAGTPHNEGRAEVWASLIGILESNHDEIEASEGAIRRSLQQNPALRTAFNRAWPLLDPAGVVGDLWSVPAYLAACAPWLGGDEVRALQRPDARAWTAADLPLLDAARRRIGDPDAALLRRRRADTLAAQREAMSRVIDTLIEAQVHDDGEGVMTMLSGQDLRNSLVDEAEAPKTAPDELAGPFAHVIVDEAQELTDAEWQMLLARCPSRSFTIVGDRAQARHGFTESWGERLARIGLDRVAITSLAVNYRTPEEIMAVAEPVIRAAIPDANVPTSVRRSGVPVTYGDLAELDEIVAGWLAEHDEGVGCVIALGGAGADLSGAAGAGRFDAGGFDADGFGAGSRIRSLTPELSKGLEFDLVVLVDPDSFGAGIEGAVDRYVAMTRATGRLVVLTSRPPDRPTAEPTQTTAEASSALAARG